MITAKEETNILLDNQDIRKYVDNIMESFLELPYIALFRHNAFAWLRDWLKYYSCTGMGYHCTETFRLDCSYRIVCDRYYADNYLGKVEFKKEKKVVLSFYRDNKDFNTYRANYISKNHIMELPIILEELKQTNDKHKGIEQDQDMLHKESVDDFKGLVDSLGGML